ncbi:MAG TPA: phosphatidylglycerol lysyltransferase domain-containing protein [Acidimicrobiales bacterium]|nr:phosphatidylglycerol lysyltransferase domain-containing protein [Acidimicrobiales bacterium]
MSSQSDVPDLLHVDVPVGGRVMVVADLHLAKDPSPGQLAAASELAATIEAATGPGVLILAGNLFDPPSGVPFQSALAAALDAHPRLCEDIAAYATGEGRRVVLMPGDRDVALASSAPAHKLACQRLGAELALTVELKVCTGAGERKVMVDPGYRYDPLSSYQDPRNPLESPYAAHLREEVLPSVRRRAARLEGADRRWWQRPRGTWLAGVEQLDDVGALSRFIASRLVYRRLLAFGWTLLIPVVFAVVLRIPATALQSARRGALTSRIGLFAAGTVIELLLLVLIAVMAIRVANRALGAVALDDAGKDPNAGPRAAARDLVTAGWTGLITGQTCRPELTLLGQGFYANAGTGADVVTEYPSRIPGLGLPSVFLAHRTLSWVELEAGNDLHVRLLHARQDLPGASMAERIFARRVVAGQSGELRPAVVATFPQGEAWPRPPSAERHDRMVRRLAAAMLVVVGFLSLVSAVSDPVSDRLHLLRDLFPMAVPETAAAVTAFFGVALIVLARGVRRGQRRAWAVCELLLVAVAALHLVKGVDIEESLIALAVAGVLYVYRSSFEARTDVQALTRGLASVAGAAVLVVAAGTIAIEISTVINHSRHRGDLSVSWVHALEATLYRMIGSGRVALPHRINNFAAPALATAAVGLVLALLAVLFRPVVDRRRARHAGPPSPESRSVAASAATSNGSRRGDRGGEAVSPADGNVLARARAIVERHGSGTLDYFALRPDKDFFFWGDTVVAHAVYGGVCLVSPDPIGPEAEREEAWRAFRKHVDSHGWALGGLGAGEEWLPIYRASGMHDLYVGDEAVVRVNRFSMDGGRFKGLRQAVNRVAKYGYTISFHDPCALDPALREELKEVMTKSRRGDVERGFSMTLGRVFDPADSGLLLAVVHGPRPPEADPEAPGPVVAFCQYVPAPGIGGYSLDLMRRDDGEHPNGLIDFAVVETIKELRSRGGEGLGLNFATMRAVLAGEAGEGMTKRIQAWLLRRMGGSMQIESLWKFNAKFDPDWQPRYAIYDAPENALAVAIAIARAESFWELPVIGRFLVPSATKDP